MRLTIGLVFSAVILIGALLVTNGEGQVNGNALTLPTKGENTKPRLGTVGSSLGVEVFSSELSKRIEEKKRSLGADYRPRTRHLKSDGSAKFTNRLFLESSPYLLQHAHNPVNWYPWDNEAFARAKELNRPVLISVGYSTCHWCHVMEDESFEDEEIARYMNENYVAIKVDREERPDVDAIYMSAVQTMTGRGGWPMTVWLTPASEPYFGGTYFPPRDGARGARVGFLTLLKRLKEAYDTDKEKIVATSRQLVKAIQDNLQPEHNTALPGAEVLHQAASIHARGFDSTYGGFSQAPKFPSSFANRFLFRYARRTGKTELLEKATFTLEKMADGGMYDQVGGGFHRYSTDARWLVPHFEKMLYDNALLAVTYLEAYQITRRDDFKRIVREILRYVERDMTSPDGAFYSATDADSPTPSGKREEGWFFTWTPEEIDKIVGSKDASLIRSFFGVTDKGNFEGRNILNTPVPLAKVASVIQLTESEARIVIERAKEQLYQARLKRPAPIRDEKVLSSWNGLMISAYAQAALILDDEHYRDMATRAAKTVLKDLYQDGRLLRSYKDSQARGNAYLDDYAFLIASFLDLYEATGDITWLGSAIELDGTLEKHYEDKPGGAFFMTSDDHEKLLAREKPGNDGAIPSGNSVAVFNLLRLHEFTTNDTYRQRAQRALQALSGTLKANPLAMSELLLALDFQLEEPKAIVIVTPQGRRSEAAPLLARLRSTFLPNRALALVELGPTLSSQSALIPALEGKRPIGDQVTAYVCKRRICKLPTSDPETFTKQISEVESLPSGG